MYGFHITPENCDYYCGAGLRQFEFDGHTRVLNANDFPFGSRRMGADIDWNQFIIPMAKWPELIAKKDKAYSWLDDLVGSFQIPCTDQNGLSWCHGWGTTTAYEVASAAAGNRYVELAPESVAGRVVNWNPDEGADPEDDMRVLQQYGACARSFLDKPWSTNPKSWKSGWEADAATHKALGYAIPTDKLWEVAGTCALKNIATSTWYNWWGHCISGSYRLKNENGKIYRKDRNNWGAKWGDNGFCWFEEGDGKGQGTPSGLAVVWVTTPDPTMLV